MKRKKEPVEEPRRSMPGIIVLAAGRFFDSLTGLWNSYDEGHGEPDWADESDPRWRPWAGPDD